MSNKQQRWKKNTHTFKRFYTEEEKKSLVDDIFSMMENSQKSSIDQLMKFAKLVLDNPKQVDFIQIEDLYSRRMLKNIKDFSDVKKTAKYRALEFLSEIVKFEEKMIKEYSVEVEKYVKRGICGPEQTRIYLENKRKKELQENNQKLAAAKKTTSSRKKIKNPNPATKDKSTASDASVADSSKTTPAKSTKSKSTSAKSTPAKSTKSKTTSAKAAIADKKELDTKATADSKTTTTDSKTTTTDSKTTTADTIVAQIAEKSSADMKQPDVVSKIAVDNK